MKLSYFDKVFIKVSIEKGKRVFLCESGTLKGFLRASNDPQLTGVRFIIKPKTEPGTDTGNNADRT